MLKQFSKLLHLVMFVRFRAQFTRMRGLLTIAICLFCFNAYSQQINGIIIDKQSGRLISGARIASSKGIVISDLHGGFLIAIKSSGDDTINVTVEGYALYQSSVSIRNAALIIALNKKAIELKEVKVYGGNRIADSINTRKMYAKAFNSAAPKFKDIVKVNTIDGPLPVTGVTIIPSEFIKALTYKHSREYKFKKTLIRDENDKYIDSRFSRILVAEITKLQTDSLSNFVDKYRPKIEALKKMTDYDIRVYIKKSLISFKHDIW